jgi:hypothetical protein
MEAEVRLDGPEHGLPIKNLCQLLVAFVVKILLSFIRFFLYISKALYFVQFGKKVNER